MAKNLPIAKSNTNLALKKAKSLIDITNKLLSGINSVATTPDEKYIASRSTDGTIKLWDIESGREVRSFEGHNYCINSVAITPDGKYIVSGNNDGTIKLWDIESGKEIRTFEGHSDSINSVAITPDGKYIVSGGGNSFIEPPVIDIDEDEIPF